MAKDEVLACVGTEEGSRDETRQEGQLAGLPRDLQGNIWLSILQAYKLGFSGQRESNWSSEVWTFNQSSKTDVIDQKMSMWKCRETSDHPSLGAWREGLVIFYMIARVWCGGDLMSMGPE